MWVDRATFPVRVERRNFTSPVGKKKEVDREG